VRLAEHAAGMGATAVMATPPLTVRAKDVLIRGYYEAIADAVTVPLIIQDSSGYLGSPLPVSVQAELFQRYGPQHVMFKPEASPIGPTLTELHRATGGEARVFDGSGGQALVDCFRRGLSGTMPGPDLVWAIAALWQALRAGDDDVAYQINGSLVPIVGSLSTLDAYIVTAKYLLVKQGVLDSARQREPRGYELDGESTEEIDRLFARLVDVVRKAQSRPNARTGSKRAPAIKPRGARLSGDGGRFGSSVPRVGRAEISMGKKGQ
jgi:dihydrodipicolinate synthase/N-acetylneuraminate lyase